MQQFIHTQIILQMEILQTAQMQKQLYWQMEM